MAISDTFYNLQWFDDEETREARDVLVEYVQTLIDDDWPSLAGDKPGERAGALKMSDYRSICLDNARAEPPVYINAIVLGFPVMGLDWPLGYHIHPVQHENAKSLSG